MSRSKDKLLLECIEQFKHIENVLGYNSLSTTKSLINEIQQALTIPDITNNPILAKIEHINDLGKSTWYEVVYYDDDWYSYAGSKTFEDGEQVVEWKYCKDCL